MDQSIREMLDRLGNKPSADAAPVDATTSTEYVEKLASAIDAILETDLSFTKTASVEEQRAAIDPTSIANSVLARMKEKQASAADDRQSLITQKVLAKLAAVEAANAEAAPAEAPPPPAEEPRAEAQQAEPAEANKDDENLGDLNLSDMLQEALGVGTSDESQTQARKAETGSEGTSDIGDMMRAKLIQKLRAQVQPEAQGA